MRRRRSPDLEVIGKKFVLGAKRPGVNRQALPCASATDFGVASVLAMPMHIGILRDARDVADLVLEELHQRQRGHVAQLPQIVRIEGLDEHRRSALGIAIACERLEHRPLLRRDRAFENGPGAWSPDRPRFSPAGARAIGALRQLHDFLEGRHPEAAVEGAVRRPQGRQALARAQRLDLGEREILREPTRHRLAVDDLGAAPVGEFRMLRDVRRAPDLVLMTRDEHAVAGHDQIGLDIVRALLDGALVTFEGMFRPLPARPAMGNDDHARRIGHRYIPA